MRKLTQFEKELRDLAGERINPVMSHHAKVRFRQRLGISMNELTEKYGNSPRIKLTVPLGFQDIHLYSKENTGVENGNEVFKIHSGTGTFVIGKVGRSWKIITFFHKKRMRSVHSLSHESQRATTF